MSFWSWNGASLSSALVDSALAGSQDDAWLSWTSVSLPATEPAAMTMMIQTASTIHFVDASGQLPGYLSDAWNESSRDRRAASSGFTPSSQRFAGS